MPKHCAEFRNEPVTIMQTVRKPDHMTTMRRILSRLCNEISAIFGGGTWCSITVPHPKFFLGTCPPVPRGIYATE